MTDTGDGIHIVLTRRGRAPTDLLHRDNLLRNLGGRSGRNTYVRAAKAERKQREAIVRFGALLAQATPVDTGSLVSTLEIDYVAVSDGHVLGAYGRKGLSADVNFKYGGQAPGQANDPVDYVTDILGWQEVHHGRNWVDFVYNAYGNILVDGFVNAAYEIADTTAEPF